MAAWLSSDNGWLKFDFLAERGLSEIRTKRADCKSIQWIMDAGGNVLSKHMETWRETRGRRSQRCVMTKPKGQVRKRWGKVKNRNPKEKILALDNSYRVREAVTVRLLNIIELIKWLQVVKAHPIMLAYWKCIAEQMPRHCSEAWVF